jgi:hypothetical protein
MAQQLTGRLTDAASGAPLAGVVLNLLDSTEAVAALAVTQPNGRFILRAPRAGTYRIRGVRIGYRPLRLGPVELSYDRTDTLDVALRTISLGLDTIRVVARSECGSVAAESEAPAFLVWEQARAAIQAASVLSKVPVSATLLVFTRHLASEDGRVIDQQIRLLNGRTLRPWGGPDPDEIHRSGYVITDANGTTTYFAPDLDVLLSSSFVADHCFGVVSSENSPEVALRFEPVRSRRRISDIAGVITLDRASAALRRLEFEYRNLPYRDIQSSGGALAPGGSLEFGRSNSGQWLITRWNVRMPVFASRTVPGAAVMGTQTIRQEVFVSRVRQEGGEISLLVAEGDTLWASEAVRLRGRVVDSEGAPAQGAVVAIEGSGRSAGTDSLGFFEFPELTPGRYHLRAEIPAVQALGLSRALAIDLLRSDTAVLIEIPSPKQQLAASCPGSASAVAGRVVDSSSVAVSMNAHAWVEWSDETTVLREVAVSPSGYFRVCGVPFHVDISVGAASERSGSLVARVRIRPERPIAFVDLALSERVITGRLTGRVLDATTGAPIPFAEIVLNSASRTTATDSAGIYHLRDLSPGKYSLTVRRIGYAAAEYDISIDAGMASRRDAALERVRTLDTVSVMSSTTITSFEENRRTGLGEFLDRAQLAKLEARRLADVVAQFNGVMVVRGGSGAAAGVVSSRGPKSMSALCSTLEDSRRGTCACAPAVYLDRVRIFAGGSGEIPNINRFTVASIEAIEFYDGPAQTPAQYSTINSHCGVLVLHTRRP